MKNEHRRYTSEATASVNDRTGLLVAIFALAISVAALVFAVLANQSSRDRDTALKDDIIRIEGDLKLSNTK